MKVYITGVSGGLGKALAEKYIKKEKNVIGFGRNCSINHPKFKFIKADLSKINEIAQVKFEDDDHVLLINNAGVIGQVKRLSDQNDYDCEEVMMVNTIAPMILSANLMKSTSINSQIIILNISSGASSRSIPSWSSYCASKAALDRFSETFYLEEKEKGRNIRVLSIAPGVLDTAMQDKIRGASDKDFSSLGLFQTLKEEHELLSPDTVAQKLVQLMENETKELIIGSLKTLSQ